MILLDIAILFKAIIDKIFLAYRPEIINNPRDII